MIAARTAAWLSLVALVAAADRIGAGAPPLVRMLALIVAGLLGMKAIVLVESRPRLAPLAFFAFTFGWVGMNPRPFLARDPARRARAALLARRGALNVVAGAALVALARFAWIETSSRALATLLLLPGLSLVLHFGLLNLSAAFWRLFGFDTDALFRAPLRSESLSEFWGRRWNLAFSEMCAIAVYRPLGGGGAGLAAAFVFSGLLHEMAISLPVRAGFGGPLAYFAIHGALAALERALVHRGRPVRGWPGRAWTAVALLAPLPLLFHPPFLRGVVWPLIGIP
jgi:alginate O-acetyltransferase complex protein AlgI